MTNCISACCKRGKIFLVSTFAGYTWLSRTLRNSWQRVSEQCRPLVSLQFMCPRTKSEENSKFSLTLMLTLNLGTAKCGEVGQIPQMASIWTCFLLLYSRLGSLRVNSSASIMPLQSAKLPIVLSDDGMTSFVSNIFTHQVILKVQRSPSFLAKNSS